jgi:threonine/homoserine/homoserine lactone efflux protein
MTYEIITALIAFAFVSSITPGPNNLMLLASGTNFGLTRTIPHMLGVSIGFAIMVILVGIGLMGLFNAYPVSYLVLKVVSVVYLLYLAWKIATAAPLNDEPGTDAPDQDGKSKPLTFIQAALFQWVNPKAWAMALTAISIYAPPSQPLSSIFLVALIFGLVNLPSVCAWVLLGTQLRRFLTDPLRLRTFNVCAALLLLGSLYPILFNPAS